MEKLVSIIIPVYNAQNYLRTCLNSIVLQTYKNFEAILINDGSKDDSRKICEEFVLQDKRFKLFNKENGGVSSARNMGLSKANGEYITFIDSDDWVEDYYLKTLIDGMENSGADVAISKRKKERGKPKTFKNKIIKSEVLDKHAAMKEMFAMRKFGGYVFKVIKKSMLGNLKFDEKISYGEDLLFSYRYMKNMNKAFFVNSPIYHYVMSKNSIVRSKFNPKKLSLLQSVEIILEDVKQSMPELEEYVRGLYVLLSFELLWYVVSSRYKNKEVKAKLKLNIKNNIKY